MKAEPIQAWQPLTFGGVARYGHDWFGKLFIPCLVVSILTAAVVVWTVHRTWEPVIREAISKLPPGAEIRGGRLTATRGGQLAENDFLAIVLDPQGDLAGKRGSDFELQFEGERVIARSLFGAISYSYPSHWTVPLNRSDMEAWWEAWRVPVLGNIAAATIIWLFASWIALGILYIPIPKLLALARARRLTIWGAWKLSVAALMPGAIFMTIAIALYGWGIIRLVDLIVALAAHFVIGWIFLAGAALRLPSLEDASANPFQEKTGEELEEDQPNDPNPFAKGNRGGPPSS